MPTHLTDQSTALIGINHSIEKLVKQLDTMALSVGRVNHALNDVADLGAKLAHRNWLIEALVGHASGVGRGGPGYGGLNSTAALMSSYNETARAITKGGGASALLHPAWEGVGRGIDPLHHRGPDYASNWVMNKLQAILSGMDKESVGYTEGNAALLGAYHSHITGGKDMPAEALEELIARIGSSVPWDKPGAGGARSKVSAEDARRGPDWGPDGYAYEPGTMQHARPSLIEEHRKYLEERVSSGKAYVEKTTRELNEARKAYAERTTLNVQPGHIYDEATGGFKDDAGVPLAPKAITHEGGEWKYPSGSPVTNATNIGQLNALKKALEEKEAAHARGRAALGDFEAKKAALAERDAKMRAMPAPAARSMADYLRELFARANDKRVLGAKLNQEELNKNLAGLSQHAAALGGVFSELSKKVVLYSSSALDAASPDAMSTLAGSSKLLFAQVGTTLVDPATRLSYVLQHLANGFDSLTPATKRLVGSFITIGGIVSLVAMGLRATGLASLGKMAWDAAPTGTAGLLGKAGVIGVGAAVTYGTSRNFIDRVEEEHQARVDFRTSAVKGSYKTTAELLGEKNLDGWGYEQYRKLYDADTTPNKAKFREQMNSFRQAQLEKYNHHFREYRMLEAPPNYHEEDGGPSAWIGKFLANSKGLYNKAFDSEGIAHHATMAATFQADQVKTTQMMHFLLSGGAKMPAFDRVARAKQDEGVVRAHGLLLDIQSRTQPSYNSIEDIYKKIQLEALAESPLQQELRQIQLRQLEELVKASEYLKAIFEKYGLMGLLTN